MKTLVIHVLRSLLGVSSLSSAAIGGSRLAAAVCSVLPSAGSQARRLPTCAGPGANAWTLVHRGPAVLQAPGCFDGMLCISVDASALPSTASPSRALAAARQYLHILLTGSPRAVRIIGKKRSSPRPALSQGWHSLSNGSQIHVSGTPAPRPPVRSPSKSRELTSMPTGTTAIEQLTL